MQEKLVFMGTPSFAVPSLRALTTRTERDRLLVVTQPDRAAGRGRRLQPPPVKVAAEEAGVEVMQVSTLRDAAARARLEEFAPDLIVVAAFGLILPRWVLRLPAKGCVNLHASLLPRFRGASPVAAAIACGDERTGVALMQMEAGLDTGAVYAVEVQVIASNDTTASLTERLSQVAAKLLDANLDALLKGELQATPQQGKVIETRKIVKDHGAIDWNRRAAEIERHVRAMWAWPRAWTVGAGGVRVQVHEAEVEDESGAGEPGVVVGHNVNGVLVGTGGGMLRLCTVQLPGKAAQPASQLGQHPIFAPGARLTNGEGFVPPDPWIVEAGEA